MAEIRAEIRRLRTRPARLRSDQADVLRQALLPFEEGEMAAHVRTLIGLIDRETASENGWTFVMLSPEQYGTVVEWLAANSCRPVVAMRMWALFFRHLRHDTGEIMLRRREIADAVGETPDNVSAIMGELHQIGAIIRRREKVAGMRGVGMVRYYVNPLIATHLSGLERDQAQQAAPRVIPPQLKLVEITE